MNLTLLAVTAWLVVGSVDAGMVSATAGAEVVGTFSQVVLVQSNAPNAPQVRQREEVVTEEQRAVTIRHYEPKELWRESLAGVAFSRAALESDARVKVSTTTEPAVNYPDGPYFEQNYPTDKLTYLGPLTTVEMPLDALDWQGGEEKQLFSIFPSFYEDVIGNVEEKDIFLEVRMHRPDGQLVFYTFDFGFFGTARFSNKFLQTNLLGSEPELLVISVQAVDLGGVLSSSSPLPQSND